jgi:hypothetical protein
VNGRRRRGFKTMVRDEWLVTRTTDDPQRIGRIKSGDDVKQRGAAAGVSLRLEIRTGPRLFLARYLSSTRSIPKNSNSNFARGSRPTRFVNSCLSSVRSCDTFATESFGSPVVRAESRTFPGAKAHFRLLVRRTHTTVAMRLWFSASLWTTTTGLRKPGPEPVGLGRSAHQISPRDITSRFAREYVVRRRKRTCPSRLRFEPGPCPSTPLRCPACDGPNIRAARH